MSRFTENELHKIYSEFAESDRIPEASSDTKEAYQKMIGAFYDYIAAYDDDVFSWSYQAGYNAGVKQENAPSEKEEKAMWPKTISFKDFKNQIEPLPIRDDEARAEVDEVNSLVSIVIEKMNTDCGKNMDADSEEIVNTLVVVNRELQRIYDDLGVILKEMMAGGDPDGEEAK